MNCTAEFDNLGIARDEGLESISCALLRDHAEDWDKVLDGIAVYDSNYKRHNIMYHQQYFIEKDETYIECSAIFYDGNHPVAIWPICVYKRNGITAIGSNGARCTIPLIMEHLRGTRVHKKMARAYFQYLYFLCIKHGIQRFEMEVNTHLYKVDIVYEYLATRASPIDYARHDLYLDLSKGIKHIENGIRKSYKSIIHKAKKELKAEIIDAPNTTLDERIEEFRRLHIAVAGRETRSVKTWDLQKKGIMDAGDFIVTLKDKSDELIGASLFTTTPAVAQYAVGAYKRELFQEYALGHVSQMAAIEHLCMLGKRWYYIGMFPLPQDRPAPTEKEITIGQFKKGFASDVVIVNKVIVTQDILREISFDITRGRAV